MAFCGQVGNDSQGYSMRIDRGRAREKSKDRWRKQREDMKAHEAMTPETESETDTETADEPKPIDAENIAQHHPGLFTVYDPQSVAVYRVNLAKDGVLDVMNAETGEKLNDPEDVTRTRILRSVVYHAPTTLSFEESHQRVLQEQVRTIMRYASNMDMNSASAGTEGAGGGSDDDDAPVFDSGGFEGSDEKTEALETWVENYANVKSDLDPGCVEITAGTYDGRKGFHIDTNPFACGYHDGDDWQDKDGFDTHREAFSEIMQGEDAVEWVEVADDDYNINFLPATKVEDVTG